MTCAASPPTAPARPATGAGRGSGRAGAASRAHSDTIFRGFLFYYVALLGAVLLADPLAREVALEGAKGLAASFNPKAGVLPLGAEAEEASDVGRGESSIGGVQGAALLVWAAQEIGDATLREMPVRHAHRHIEFCLREDGSVCQSAAFDPQTDHMIPRYTHKGVRDDSTPGPAPRPGP